VLQLAGTLPETLRAPEGPTGS